MARPTKLTREVHDQIVTDIEAGNFAVIAATAAGITEQTYYNWLNRGSADLQSDDPDVRGSIYAEFFESVKRSEAKAEISQLREMNRDDKWQRRAWWLERRFPKRWGQKAALELSGPDGGPMQVTNTTKAEVEAFLDERADSIAAAQKALADARADEANNPE